jgi:GT2 family glycosyltransferase/glycosyltransferase involved in cell wall biosynthesis
MTDQYPRLAYDIALAELETVRIERDIANLQLQTLLRSRWWRLGAHLHAIARLAGYTASIPPTPTLNTVAQRLASGRASPVRPALLCFANIRWEARYQRPQQLMTQFAQQGWRVFYIVPSRDALQDKAYVLEQKATNVTQVRLHCAVPHDYYTQLPSAEQCAHYRAALHALCVEQQISHAWSVVHLSYWTPLVLSLGWPVVYDCMDDWDGFPNIGPRLLEAERQLAAVADLVTVSAVLLHDKWVDRSQTCTLIRNAVEFPFFQQHCKPNAVLPAFDGPVIGYYGALADWFDFELLADIARRRPDWTFVLVGDVFVDDLLGLDRLPNVRLEGPKPYEQMPLYLHHFDVCLIPFRLYHVTHAVDPVKLYEYLSVGKPVVSVPLEEIRHYADLVYFATSAETFIEQINCALVEPAARSTARVALARDNTWHRRFVDSQQVMQTLAPKVSIIVVTYNNLALTAQCLDSLARNTRWPAYQVIVVDNGSQDATPAYLAALRERMPGLEVILNPDNRGFAAANNQGLRLADGHILILLNNDTVVPTGWLKPLVRRLQDPTVGLVGPVTNNVGNEARIEVDYTDIEQMQDFADRYTAAHANRSFDIPMLAMFCVALRRDVLDRVGALDEQFGIGLFEDDDYSRRVQALGLRTVCVENAYIHHYGQATFKALIVTGEYQALWERNQIYFESKWGAWQAHRPRAVESAPA